MSVSYTHLDVYKRQVLAHPEGYEVMDDVMEVAKENAEKSSGSFRVTNSMEDAFKDADIVYPKSWAPFKAVSYTHLDVYKRQAFFRDLQKELFFLFRKVRRIQQYRHPYQCLPSSALKERRS